MRKHVLVSAALSLGRLGAAGVSAQTLTALPPSNGSLPSDFDGSYAGLQRHLDGTGELRSASGRTNGCSISPHPPRLTIQNGIATMPWCFFTCTMKGQVDKTGHLEMRANNPAPGPAVIEPVITVHLYPKGTHEFDAMGHVDSLSCGQVMTWRRDG